MIRIFLMSFLPFLVFGMTNAQNTVKIQAGAILKITGDELVSLQDLNLDNDGVINLSPGDGTIRFSGSQNNTITGNSAPTFDILDIAKTGGGKLSLGRNINIRSSINFISGLIDLNNYNILLQSNALLSSESESSHITGSNGGYVEISKTLNSPSAANPGNLGAVISSSQNMGNTVNRQGHKFQMNGSGNGTTVFRYFDIIPANNSSLNAIFRFKYLDAELNALDENTLVLWKSSDTLVWFSQGYTTRDIAGNYVEKTGIPDFSRWTLSSPNNSLPVHFLSFNGNCTGTSILIKWVTVNEVNTSLFVVERSTDDVSWTTIGIYPSSSLSSGQNYIHTDLNAIPYGAFYRIVEYDINGLSQITSVIHIDCSSDDSWLVMPNPVFEQLLITIHTVSSSRVILRIFDENGTLMSEQQNKLLPGTNPIKVDIKQLAAGIYHIMAEWDNGRIKKIEKILRH